MKEVMQPNPLVGTWQLVSQEIRYTDGAIDYLMGRDALGYLLYTDEGSMFVAFTSARRPPFAGCELLRGTIEDEVLGGTIEEQAQAYRTYRSYCGRYEVSGDTVVHHVEVSLFPNWAGQDLVRQIEWNGDQLVLKTRPALVGGKQGVWYQVCMVWKRVSSHK